MLKIPVKSLMIMFVAGLVLAAASILFLDKAAYTLISTAVAGQQRMWEFVTLIGSYKWMIGLTLLITGLGVVLAFFRPDPVWKKLRRSGFFVLLSVAPVALVAYFLKGTIGRARPYLFESEGPLSFAPFTYQDIYAGFPSGHTTIAFAFATVITILFPRLAIPVFAVAVMTGFSRLALSVHYLGDIIAGATFGTIGTIFVAKIIAHKLGILSDPKH